MSRTFPDRVCRRWVLLAATWLVGYFVLIAATKDSESGRLFVGDILYLVPLAGSVAVALVAARRLTGRHRTFWSLLTIAYTAQLLGEGVWSGYDYLAGDDFTQPLLADVGYLTASAVTLVAVLVGFGGASALRRLRGLVDTAIIVLGVGAAAWHTVIRPQLSADLNLTDLINLTYPVLDTAMICCVLIIGAGGHTRIPLAVRLVGISCGINAVCDLAYTYVSVNTEYDSGGWLDAAFSVGIVCNFVAAIVAIRQPEPPAEPRSFDRGLNLTPVLLSSAAVFTLLASQKARTGNVDTTTLAISGVLFIGVLFRQYLFTADRTALAEQLRQAVEEQQRLAVTDSLTGLHNRRYFTEELAARQAGGALHPAALLVVDLDHFKSVNDTYGHLQGDVVLREAAARIAAALRPGDLVARWGGEEFVVLLPDTPEAEATGVAERIRRQVAAQPVRLTTGPVSVTASLGVATSRHGTDSMLVERADQALYEAKRSGRDRVRLWEAATPARSAAVPAGPAR
ncbi:GGDEF domain-containing protein [Actinoplanes sp. NPDC048796]|uniref:GGDEF domain-containing protein n=1 Tax=unclassified Actinoplanes TaxID=2626549 RepID=UPI00340644EC